MKSLIQKLLALTFAAMLLAACGKQEEAATEAAPAEESSMAESAPMAEPAQGEPGGWVPPAEEAAPAAEAQ
jgi:hypothetical protein